MDGTAPTSDPGSRRVGARVLPQVPEPPAGLHHGLVERRELERSGRAVRRDLARGLALEVGVALEPRDVVGDERVRLLPR